MPEFNAVGVDRTTSVSATQSVAVDQSSPEGVYDTMLAAAQADDIAVMQRIFHPSLDAATARGAAAYIRDGLAEHTSALGELVSEEVTSQGTIRRYERLLDDAVAPGTVDFIEIDGSWYALMQ